MGSIAYIVVASILLVIQAGASVIGPSDQFGNPLSNTTGDGETTRILITVIADPDDGVSLRVKIYSRDDSLTKTFTEYGDMELGFTAGVATKFWVDATWTQGNTKKIILVAPVFGDGVPKKSGHWFVDFRGLKRIKEDSDDCPPCDQFSKSWRNI